jgi:hypothetical protein
LEKAGALIFFFSRLSKRRKNRRFWVHPILKDQSTKGIFYTLYSDLRQNPDKFFIFARMSIASFDELLQCMKKHNRPLGRGARAEKAYPSYIHTMYERKTDWCGHQYERPHTTGRKAHGHIEVRKNLTFLWVNFN